MKLFVFLHLVINGFGLRVSHPSVKFSKFFSGEVFVAHGNTIRRGPRLVNPFRTFFFIFFHLRKSLIIKHLHGAGAARRKSLRDKGLHNKLLLELGDHLLAVALESEFALDNGEARWAA